jgi:ribose transport system substrate-binding protein
MVRADVAAGSPSFVLRMLVFVVLALAPGLANAAERLAVFTKNATNPNYVAFRIGADRAAARLGATAYHRVPAKPDDAEQQIEMLESAIKDRPDAILLAVADDRVLGPTVQKINAAGIPYIAFVDRSPTGRAVTFIGSDDFAMGQATARYLAEKMGAKGKLVIIEGTEGAPTSRERVAGFRRTLESYPNIVVLASVSGRYQKPDAVRAMEKVLAQYPEIDAVLSANDSMAIGVLDALDAAGRKALVTGINGTIEAAQAIASGRLLASEDYSGFDMGCIASEAALRSLRGQKVPEEILLPVKIIDRANVDRWLVPVEQRTCPDWDQVVAARPAK